MGGFEVAKLYVLGLWPVAANGISSAETSGSAPNGSIELKTLGRVHGARRSIYPFSVNTTWDTRKGDSRHKSKRTSFRAFIRQFRI